MITKTTQRISGKIFVIMARVASAAPLAAPLSEVGAGSGRAQETRNPRLPVMVRREAGARIRSGYSCT
jgi:hypothetical protein